MWLFLTYMHLRKTEMDQEYTDRCSRSPSTCCCRKSEPAFHHRDIACALACQFSTALFKLSGLFNDVRAEIDPSVGKAFLAAPSSAVLWRDNDAAELGRREDVDRCVIVASQILDLRSV